MFKEIYVLGSMLNLSIVNTFIIFGVKDEHALGALCSRKYVKLSILPRYFKFTCKFSDVWHSTQVQYNVIHR